MHGPEAEIGSLPRVTGPDRMGLGNVQLPDGHQPEPAEREYWLRTLVEGMPQLIWRSCDLGNWTWASPQWMALTGLRIEDSLGRGWLDAVHPDDRSATITAWDEARPHGMLDVEFRVRRSADGIYIWHRTRSIPVRNDQGAIVEWLGTTTDIQALKTLQEAQAALLSEAQR